jgi:hypothetical protein
LSHLRFVVGPETGLAVHHNLTYAVTNKGEPMAGATNTKTTTRASRGAATAWSFGLAPEEGRSNLNVSLPDSLIKDLELLKAHFGTGMPTIVEKTLRQGLSTNTDLARLKAAATAEPKADSTKVPHPTSSATKATA